MLSVFRIGLGGSAMAMLGFFILFIFYGFFYWSIAYIVSRSMVKKDLAAGVLWLLLITLGYSFILSVLWV